FSSLSYRLVKKENGESLYLDEKDRLSASSIGGRSGTQVYSISFEIGSDKETPTFAATATPASSLTPSTSTPRKPGTPTATTPRSARASQGCEMTQAERDRLEEERIAKAKAE